MITYKMDSKGLFIVKPWQGLVGHCCFLKVGYGFLPSISLDWWPLYPNY